jgi:hypothetical protein
MMMPVVCVSALTPVALLIGGVDGAVIQPRQLLDRLAHLPPRHATPRHAISRRMSNL